MSFTRVRSVTISLALLWFVTSLSFGQSIEEMVQRGLDAYQRADFRTAAGYLENALKQDPGLSQATVAILGSAYELMGHDDEAMETYSRILGKEFDKVALNLVQLYIKHGRVDEAKYVIGQGYSRFEKDEDRLKRMSALLDDAWNIKRGEIDDSLKIEYYKRILFLDQRDLASYVGFARILIRRGNFTVLEKLIDLFHRSLPGNQRLDLMLGRGMFALGKFDSAAAIASRVVQSDPLSTEGFLLSGDIALQRGQPQDALGFYNRALNLNPALVEAYTGVASVHTMLRDTVKAITAWDKAVSLEPGINKSQYTNLCVGRGIHLLLSGDVAAAIKQFSKVDSLPAPAPGDELTISEAYYRDRRIRNARDHATRGLERLTGKLEDHPEESALLVDICECHIILGDFLSAENDLQRYIIRVGQGKADLARQRLQLLINAGINPEDARMLSSKVFPEAVDDDIYPGAAGSVTDTTRPAIVIRNTLRTRGMRLIEETADSLDVSGLASDSSGIVAVYVNGAMARLQEATKDELSNAGLGGRGVKFEGLACLIAGDNEIEVRAIDAKSNMSTVSVTTGSGERDTRSNSLAAKIPHLWAVVTGISRYQRKEMRLNYADKDALLFYGFLKGSSGGKVPDDRIDLLLNANATRARILQAIHNKLGRAAEDDMVIVYFACHGIPDDNGNDVYFMGSDGDPANVVGTGISQSDIYRAIESARARKVVLIADACHSGSLGMTTPNIARRGSTADLTRKLMKEIAEAHQGVAYLLASSASEFSEEGKRWGGGHGAFTYYLVNGLFGAADLNHNGVVTVREVLDYVYRRVADDSNESQHPILQGHFDNNLPLSVVR